VSLYGRPAGRFFWRGVGNEQVPHVALSQGAGPDVAPLHFRCNASLPFGIATSLCG